ncbi:MAG: hypothetical protein COV76_02910 [Candidatus Omnitrophica bacterium CG11_big_fil_rev_8_21_14_0_20_64_10]|nr:MAG: hypothetical protein COV76_02910 [Candidatus Omnitrophica bacterium CG11_big_fil_rev_8_21_14_0_20_64_10]
MEAVATPEGTAIEIRGDSQLHFVTYSLRDPDRLVIDWVDARVDSPLEDEKEVSVGMVRSWTIARREEVEHWDEVDSVTFYLDQPVEHRIEGLDGKLVLQLRPKRLQESFGAQVLRPEGGPGLSAVAGTVDGGPAGVWQLDQILQWGLARNRNFKISQQEVELAQMKVREAKRALFPAATIRTSWTEGTASQIDFREFSTGLQLEQPLYHSGRLRQTHQQSLVNLQVSEKRQAKVKADAAYEIIEAYYQFVGARAALAAQESLVAEAADFLGKARTRFDRGLLTRLELLNVESQANQAQLQRATAENDLMLARLAFSKVLRLDPAAGLDVPAVFPEASGASEIRLPEVLTLAAQYRPDIQVNHLLVQFQEYEERIAKLKGKLRVDLSGFVGTSASAFETESLDPQEDYFVGLRATKDWGPNESVVSVTDTHTSPRLGQTTRTDSIVYSGELNILNKLDALSEVKQAGIDAEKARRDLEEARAEVKKESHEAFLSYEKAQLQLTHARQKISFREEQVKILKAQAGLNEALPSQVLEAIVQLTDERVGEAQALTNLYVALAKLNKAVGLMGHYR